MLVQDAPDFIRHLYQRRVALPAFNVCNLEMVQGVLEAATQEKAPVILQTYVGDVEHAGLRAIATIIKTLAAEVSVPVLLHHDHASDYTYILRVLREGYGSCMVDTGGLPLEAAIAKTAELTKIAHAMGVAIEGELGSWDNPDDQTDPGLVGRVIEETGVDMLAVSVGSQHGQASRLKLPLLQEIVAQAAVPLVLHGGSGIDAGDLQAAIRLGVVKVNVGAALSRAWAKGSVEAVETHGHDSKYLHYAVLKQAKERVREAASEKLRLTGAAGKA